MQTPPLLAILPAIVSFFLLIFCISTFSPRAALRATWTGRLGLILGAASGVCETVYWYTTVSDPNASRLITPFAWIASGVTLTSIVFCLFGRTLVCYLGAALLTFLGYLWMTWINTVCCHL
jgi:hypothetical protein